MREEKITMQKLLTKREKAIFYTTIAVIGFAVIFNFLLAPILAKSGTLNKEINLTRAKVKKYLWLLKQKKRIEDKASKFPSMVSAVIRQEEASGTMFSELEDLAKSAGVRIIDIRPEAVAKNTALTVDLRTEGTQEAYLRFIYNLENSLSLLRIKNFQLTSRSNSQSLEGNFSISQLSPSD